MAARRDVPDRNGEPPPPGRWGRFRPRATRGRDIEAEIEVSVAEAYTGGRCRVALETTTGTRDYGVTIPAGVTDGYRLRMIGRGGPGVGGGPPGDLVLVVHLVPGARCRVDGRDVTVVVPVAPWEAALGATVAAPTPAGPVPVRVPAGASSGRRLRLPGLGLPDPRGAPGDLYAEIEVVVPDAPTAAERALFARLAELSSFDPRSARPPSGSR
ncbi:DnaJ C-terminal domain-containing protein [Planosporangium sp. 12N6]|uniref:DnaJ C-terminal domain-containing protein n=1 Tax=Planosporangium spinosum TaxID=3402278 RepID=UPI003CEFBB22